MNKFMDFFEKMPFKKWCEKFSAKLPFLAKVAPIANFVVSGLAVVIVVVVIACVASSGKSKDKDGTAKEVTAVEKVADKNDKKAEKTAAKNDKKAKKEKTAEKTDKKASDKSDKKAAEAKPAPAPSKPVTSLNDLEGYWMDVATGNGAGYYFHNGKVYLGIGYYNGDKNSGKCIYDSEYRGASLQDSVLSLPYGFGRSQDYKIKNFDGNSFRMYVIDKGVEYDTYSTYKKFNGKVVNSMMLGSER